MKILIKTDDQEPDQENAVYLELSQEELNNNNFIDITIEDKTYTIPLDHLLSACIAFDSERIRRLELDKFL